MQVTSHLSHKMFCCPLSFFLLFCFISSLSLVTVTVIVVVVMIVVFMVMNDAYYNDDDDDRNDDNDDSSGGGCGVHDDCMIHNKMLFCIPVFLLF